MNIFTFDQVYNVVRAQAAANSIEAATNMTSSWNEFYNDDDEIYELIEKLPKNNTFEEDIQTAAALLQADFDDLHESDSDEEDDNDFIDFEEDEFDVIEELNEQHRYIKDKMPDFLDKYIK